MSQHHLVGGCEHPIQLSGNITATKIDNSTGEINRSSDHIATYASCKTRRATRCEPCSTLYQHDARHLIGSGLRGGEGVAGDVATRPAFFITLTAPSFGQVHSTREGKQCLPRRDAKRCSHGKTLVCWDIHTKDDHRVGRPICVDCYDYEGSVLWNNAASSLWRTTRINIDRQLAKALQERIADQTGKLIPRAELKKNFSTNYIKVSEFQARGLVHFHITLRVDGKRRGRPAPFSTQEIELTIKQLITNASTNAADGSRISWGNQTDVDVLPQDNSDEEEQDTERRPATRRQVANYLAKYATKGSDIEGKLDRRFKNEEELKFLGVNNHLSKMVRVSWQLARKYPDAKLDTWSHQLGYRGHFLSKSRNWSTTFKALRQVRKDHQEQIKRASWAALNPEVTQVIETKWSFITTGHKTGLDSAIAEAIRSNQPRHTNRAA